MNDDEEETSWAAILFGLIEVLLVVAFIAILDIVGVNTSVASLATIFVLGIAFLGVSAILVRLLRR